MRIRLTYIGKYEGPPCDLCVWKILLLTNYFYKRIGRNKN